MKRLTSKESRCREPEPMGRAVLDHREPRVLRAGRRKPTRRADERGDDFLVSDDPRQRDPGQHAHRWLPIEARGADIDSNAPRNSVTSAANFTSSARPLPTTTITADAGAAS